MIQPKIILKEREDGKYCLFDTRSEQFFKNGCVNNPESSDLVGLANSIVNKSYKTICETAQSLGYSDYGYLEQMIASEYIKLNPDIPTKVLEKLNKPKTNKRLTYTPKSDRKKKKEFVNATSGTAPRKHEQAKKEMTNNDQPKRGRGRPRKEVTATNNTVADQPKRGRGRPRKNPV